MVMMAGAIAGEMVVINGGDGLQGEKTVKQVFATPQ